MTGPSSRKAELLAAAYEYVLEHGLAELSLRPLAAAIGSSPRVLLFLFGSKDGLVRELLTRARADELAVLARLPSDGGLAATAERVWDWLAGPERGPLLTLWLEAYGRSLVEPTGPWAGFAKSTVEDWLGAARVGPAAGGTADPYRRGPADPGARGAAWSAGRPTRDGGPGSDHRGRSESTSDYLSSVPQTPP